MLLYWLLKYVLLGPWLRVVFRPVAPVELWATDAALSPDGRDLAVRGYLGGIHYAWNGGIFSRFSSSSFR